MSPLVLYLKFSAVVIAIAAAILVPFWIGMTSKPVEPDADMAQASSSDLYVSTDTLTGCQYLSRGAGLTPRLRADGSHICGAKP